jgi:hypothetical protein
MLKNTGGRSVLVKISRNSMITQRVGKLKETVKVDTQKLRKKALDGLEELFDLAQDMAKNKNVKLKQRQMWARIAAYIAQIINSVATGFDERQIDKDLNELERLVNEAKTKMEKGKTQEGNASTGRDKASRGPCGIFH